MRGSPGPGAEHRRERAARSQEAGVTVRLDRRAPTPAVAPVLDAQQRAVVEHRGGHLLVLAGPGTGKTATLTELVVARLADPQEPLAAESVLALTFGRRAAGELADRISQRLAGGPAPLVSTFHSFAYAALRQHGDPDAFTRPPTLLMAAEQDARLREMLGHSIAEGRLVWPESLSGAVGTLGIAEQVRSLIARARGQGLDGRRLSAIGRREGVEVWAALGGFFEEYLDTLGFEGSIDYAELINQAAALAHDPRRGRALREQYRLIVVDEYQDTDPAQVSLLRGLATGGAQVVAVGDPDQAIYGFRGADVRGILRFPQEFADASGAPAHIQVLTTTRRFPRAIADAAQAVLGPVSLAPLPAEVQRRHRTPQAQDRPAQVDVRTYPSAAAEAAGVAETLLRAHAGLDGRPALRWSQMAVLVRSPAIHGPALARAMRAAGIPVWMPPDETPLAEEPAVGVLLDVVGLALGHPGLADDVGRRLLSGPVGRVDPVSIRALSRSLLRHAVHDAAPSRADVLLTAAVADTALPEGIAADLPGAVRAGFGRVARAVIAAREAIAADQLVSEVLWAAWTATDWPDRLRRAALTAGDLSSAGSAAHRDLDALVALFELANRLPSQRHGSVGTAAFLSEVRALRLPQEARGPVTESERDQVRLLSAHRAKGLEWELVVVACVQEGQWPDVRLRSDLLHVAELGPRGRLDPQSHADLLAEERRLMYVACTRARSRLIVTAVSELVDGGVQASRFLRELGPVPTAMPGRSASPLSGEGIIAALREAAQAPTRVRADGTPDPEVEALRQAAVLRLAALAQRARAGGALGALAAAEPGRWWGSRAVTGSEAAAPAGSAGEPARLSPSSLAALRECPLRWFLDKRVKAGTPAGAAATMGRIVHAVADAIARGEVPAEETAIAAYVDGIWGSVAFPAQYQRTLKRAELDQMIGAFLAWHRGSGREVIGSEVRFDLLVTSGPVPVRIAGTIDRLDRSGEGALHVVDFKTGRTPASRQAAREDPQLGLYQLAVRSGALDGAVADPAAGAEAQRTARLGQAELVYLGARTAAQLPTVRTQAPLEQGRVWVHDLIDDAAQLAAGPGYPARPGAACRSCAFRFMCPAHVRAPGPGAAVGVGVPASALGPGAPEGHGPSDVPDGDTATASTRSAAATRPSTPARPTSPAPASPAREVQGTLFGEEA